MIAFFGTSDFNFYLEKFNGIKKTVFFKNYFELKKTMDHKFNLQILKKRYR